MAIFLTIYWSACARVIHELKPMPRRLVRFAPSRFCTAASGVTTWQGLHRLEALVADERAAAAQAAARARVGSVEAVTLEVNAQLVAKGCCQKGRLALLGCSTKFLSYRRKRGRIAVAPAGPRASVPRTLRFQY